MSNSGPNTICGPFSLINKQEEVEIGITTLIKQYPIKYTSSLFIHKSIIEEVSEPLGEDHLPTPATLPSLPEQVQLVAMAVRATDNTEKVQREDGYESVVTSGNRVLPQDKHVDRQDLIIKVIINDHGNS